MQRMGEWGQMLYSNYSQQMNPPINTIKGFIFLLLFESQSDRVLIQSDFSIEIHATYKAHVLVPVNFLHPYNSPICLA